MRKNQISAVSPKEFNACQPTISFKPDKNVKIIKPHRQVNPILENAIEVEATESTSSHDNREIKKESDKRHQFRLQAIDEIFQSEKSYLRQLKNILDYFVVPLKEMNIISVSTHMILFGHIEMIYNLNNELFSILNTDLDNVAKAFLKMAPFFKLYSVYAFDYKNAILTLQDLMEKNSKFKGFLEKAESRAQTKLNSLMIAPIQRIPRYKLLLEQVLLYTSPADPDCKILKESIKEIECTVSHIDSVIEDQEATQVLLNLQNSLVNNIPNIIKPGRKVIKEGILNKITRTGSQIKRYCILMSDLFMYCKILKDRPKYELIENSLECCCIFPLKKCKIFEMFPGNFKVSCQGDGLILSIPDSHLAKSWITTIRDAIDMYVECRKTLRKESSKRIPIRKRNVKNFDVNAINEAKKSDFESIYRGAGSLDDEETVSKNGISKFLISKIPRLLKRKQNNTCVVPTVHPIKMKTLACSKIGRSKICSLIKSSKSNSNDTSNKQNLSTMKSDEVSEELDADAGFGFGFAAQYLDATSYFRTNSVDNIISPNSMERSPCIGDIATICDHGLSKTTRTPFFIPSDFDCIPTKRMKLDEEYSADQMRMKLNPFYEEPGTDKKADTIDRYYKEKPFDFPSTDNHKLKDRILNFFSSLF